MNIDLEDIAADERFIRRQQARDAGEPWWAIEQPEEDTFPPTGGSMPALGSRVLTGKSAVLQSPGTQNHGVRDDNAADGADRGQVATAGKTARPFTVTQHESAQTVEATEPAKADDSAFGSGQRDAIEHDQVTANDPRERAEAGRRMEGRLQQ